MKLTRADSYRLAGVVSSKEEMEKSLSTSSSFYEIQRQVKIHSKQSGTSWTGMEKIFKKNHTDMRKTKSIVMRAVILKNTQQMANSNSHTLIIQVFFFGNQTTNSFSSTKRLKQDQGSVSRRSRKVFAPGKPYQNLKPYDYRAVLFTYS